MPLGQFEEGKYCKSRYACYFRIFRTRRLAYETKMHAKHTKQVRESTVVSDCTKSLCVRKVGEPRIRKLSAHEIFWIYRIAIAVYPHTSSFVFFFVLLPLFRIKKETNVLGRVVCCTLASCPAGWHQDTAQSPEQKGCIMRAKKSAKYRHVWYDTLIKCMWNLEHSG